MQNTGHFLHTSILQGFVIVELIIEATIYSIDWFMLQIKSLTYTHDMSELKALIVLAADVNLTEKHLFVCLQNKNQP